MRWLIEPIQRRTVSGLSRSYGPSTRMSVSAKLSDLGFRAGLELLNCIAAEDHRAKAQFPGCFCQCRRGHSVCERLPAEKGDAFNTSLVLRLAYPRGRLVAGPGLTADEREELRIAASGTAQRTALEPDGEPLPRAFGLGTRHHLGNLHRLH